MIEHARVDDAVDRVAFDEARRLMLAAVEPLGVQTVALDAAAGRIVGRPLRATEDIVPYTRSAMDGYAIRARDTVDADRTPIVLRVIGSAFAGDAPAALVPKTAMAIATGAPLPDGADAVVPIERVQHAGTSVVLGATVRAGDHVFLAGDDAKRGDVLVDRGDVITPGRAALLAAAGHAAVIVHRRPRVAIVCTGDELVGVSEQPERGQVRNSNATMLAAQVAGDGADVVSVAIASDRVGEVRAALEHAVANADLVITTGGASVGRHDFVKSTLAAMGARFAFRSIAMRPSKPTAFARAAGAVVVVLPGNPAAAFVAYASLVRGVVRRLAGRRIAFPAPLTATLRGSIHAKARRHFLVFGRVERDGSHFSVVPVDNQCSSLVRTSADANGLIVVAPDGSDLAPGDMVSVEILDWTTLAGE
jgi:molybdopterin molybdotransferase